MFDFISYSAERLEFLLLIILRTSQMQASGHLPLDICSPNIKLVLRRLAESSSAGLNVVSFNKILPDTEIVSIGMLRTNDEN